MSLDTGGWTVPFYRAYHLKKTSELIDVSKLESPDDNAAIERARQLFASDVVELWEGDRKAARLDLWRDRKQRKGDKLKRAPAS